MNFNENQSPISSLISDVLKEIFSILNCSMYAKLSLVSKKWNKVADQSLFKELLLNKIAFTPHDWNRYCGLLSEEEIKKQFNTLPKNIFDILKKECKILDKRILDTHKLIWIPEKFNEKPLTLNYLKKLTNLTFDNDFQLGDTPISSGWILMANAVLASSLNKPYSNQNNLLETFNIKDNLSWQVPTLTEVIACLSLIYLKFGKNAELHSSYTWCQDKNNKKQIAIKWSADSTLHILAYAYKQYDFIGIAPIWHL